MIINFVVIGRFDSMGFDIPALERKNDEFFCSVEGNIRRTPGAFFLRK